MIGLVQLFPSQFLIWIYVNGQKPLYPFTGHKLGVTRGQMNTEVTSKHIPSTLCICRYLYVLIGVHSCNKPHKCAYPQKVKRKNADKDILLS